MTSATPQFPQVASFILVGGQSSRMGRDKALLEIAGKPLLIRAADLLMPLVASVTLVTSEMEASSGSNLSEPSKYDRFGFPVIADKWPGAGPLGAIATALAAAREPWSMILACDLPYLTGEWLAWLLARTVKHSEGKPVDIIIPESARGLEPLCAVYRSSCAQAFAAALDAGIRKVTDAFAGLNVERIGENESRRFSPNVNLFQNMNTWEDYLEARAHFEK